MLFREFAKLRDSEIWCFSVVTVFVIIISSFFIIIGRTATAIIAAVLAATYQRPERMTGNTWAAVSLTQAAWRTAI